MEEPDEFVHIVPSLDAYPRVHFFYRNLKSLIPRFKRVAGTLPNCFQNTDLDKELYDTLELMRCGVRVTILRNEDVDRHKFIISSSGQETGNVELIPKIDVYYVKTNGVASSNVKEVWSLVENCTKRRSDINWNLVCLCCEINAMVSHSDIDKFKTTVLDELHDHKIQLLQSNITVTSNANIKIAEQISDFLEAFVIQGFVNINKHLDRFVLERVPSTHTQRSTNDLLDSLQNDIFTWYTLNDLDCIQSDTNTKTENQSVKTKNQNIVSAVPRVVKCLLVPTLAEKFSLSVDDCNKLICDTNFENHLSNVLKKELISSQHEKGERRLDGEWIIKQLHNVLPDFISEIESELQRTKRVINVMRRMKYEVHGYLKHTKFPTDNKPRPVAPTIPDELREALQRIKGVFGLGTFYGQIEIHLEAPMAVDDGTTELDIKHLMNKYRFSYPYLIKHVTQKPKAISFDPGSKLHVISSTKGKNGGTLGGYIIDQNGKVYALTCAHVVGKGGNSNVFVCTDQGDSKTPLSAVQDHFSSGSCSDFLFVDIAAAHVLDSIQGSCKEYLKKPRSPVQLVSVTKQTPEELVGDKVVKIGGYSGKTYGIIGAVDYGLFGRKAQEYLMSIYPLPGEPEGNVAGNGIPMDNDASGPSQLDVGSHIDQIPCDESEIRAKSNEPLVQRPPGETLIDTCEMCLSDITNTPSATSKVRVKQSDTGSANITNQQMDETQPNEMDVGNSGIGEFKVFVRKANTYDDEENTSAIFARRGDSGSIVCTNELSGHSEKCTAISMVSAGEFDTRHEVLEDDGDKDICLAFNLHVGLEKLQEHANMKDPIRFI